MTGPLRHIRIIEFSSIGPSPFACMMLADNGADVIRIARKVRTFTDDIIDPSTDMLNRNRRVVYLDLKDPVDIDKARALCKTADGIVEGFRPGVMEKLDLGPDVLLADNPALVYGRMTGWGQTGPLAHVAGHDLNYLALSGALHIMGREGEKPLPPVNLVGDFGGGGMMLAFGMVSAILHAKATGEGQVIDVSMVEGSALLMTLLWSLRANGDWLDERGVNMIDTGAHFYETYETADGKYVSIGPIEPQFYALFREKLGAADDPAFDPQFDRTVWPMLKDRLTAIFKMKTRDEWCEIFEYTDTCFAPVLSMEEAPMHPHNIARGVFVEVDGVLQPAPGPRYSKTVNSMPRMLAQEQDDGAEIWREISINSKENQ